MTAKNATVVLTQAEARWVLSLTAAAAHLTLEARARRTNLAVFGRVCDALARSGPVGRRPPPVPTGTGRWAGTTWAKGTALSWVERAGGFVPVAGMPVLPDGPGVGA